jgi:hypothetical protein
MTPEGGCPKICESLEGAPGDRASTSRLRMDRISIEEKVEHDDEEQERETEHCLVPPQREVIDRDQYNQHGLRDNPDERPPFDVTVADATGKLISHTASCDTM